MKAYKKYTTKTNLTVEWYESEKHFVRSKPVGFYQVEVSKDH